MNCEMERVNGSFIRNIQGEITTPAPYVALIKDKSEFSHFLMDRTLFFDGRFAFYDKYESESFYKEHDLIAVIVRGEHEISALERVKNVWQIKLRHTEGENHTMYFISAPKEQGMTGAMIV